MSTLCLHSGAEAVQRENLIEIPVPSATKTYCPVEHFKLLNTIEESAIGAGHVIDSLEIGIQSAKRGDDVIPGAKMFSIMRLKSDGDTGGDNLRLDIGIRNSYDKSVAVGIVAGASVFVCDNMMITGEIQAVRKHTPNVWQDVLPMVTAVLLMANKQHEIDQAMREAFMRHGIETRMGMDLLGKMAAHGFISYAGGNSSMFALALQQWQEPTYEEFQERNIWSLYNACTFGTKKSTMSNAMLDNAKVTCFFRDQFTPAFTDEAKTLNLELDALREELSYA